MATMFGKALKNPPQLFLESRASGKVISVNALDNLTLSHAYNLMPAVLKCEIVGLKSAIGVGDAIVLTGNNENIFKGYVTDTVLKHSNVTKIVAYDQLFYFHMRDTYFYKNKSAGEILKKWASYFGLKIGNIDCSTHKILLRNEWNRPIRDMLRFAIDETYYQTGVRLILFDKGGKIHLERSEKLMINAPVLDFSTARSFVSASSISHGAINRVKLAYKDPKSGIFEIFTAKNALREQDWGVLQYYSEVNDKDSAKGYAERLLKRKCSALNTFSVRNMPIYFTEHLYAGCSVHVKVENEIKTLLAENITHHFLKGRHTADVSFRV